MWEKIIVVAIVLAAVAALAYRFSRVLRGRSRCNCPQSPRCPASKPCKGPAADKGPTE